MVRKTPEHISLNTPQMENEMKYDYKTPLVMITHDNAFVYIETGIGAIKSFFKSFLL